MSVLDYRDAFADYRAVASECRFESGPDTVAPRVTIAIPTFRRPDVLLEAVASALAQLGDTPFEVLIVDNDPDRAKSDALVATLPRNAAHRLRYYVNADNIGMFGNWNRCIELARGEWVTLLNDDDLLRPNYLQHMMALVAKRPEAAGITCQKDRHYRTPVPWTPAKRGALGKLWARIKRTRYDRDGLTEVTPRTMFFGLELGNGLGFLFKRDAAIALGGYYQEDFPTSDGYFYVRFAQRYTLLWSNEVLADIGVGENESMRPETLESAVYRLEALRRAMLGKDVPESWRRIDPQLTANSIHDAKKEWQVDLDRAQFERDFGMPLPAANYKKVILFRLLHNGF
jgi:glycosyltransferase involved in cell wall biosynthesis